MKRIILSAFVALLALAAPALAQTPQLVQPCAGTPCAPISTTNPIPVAPSPSATGGIAPTTSAALASSTVIKSGAGSLYSFEVAADSTLSGAAWWIMLFDATAAPGDGAVTPYKCFAMSSGTTSFSAAWPTPLAFATGMTIGVSTTGCFSKTASVHAFISGDAK